jgi:hypothetical protein
MNKKMTRCPLLAGADFVGPKANVMTHSDGIAFCVFMHCSLAEIDIRVSF